MQFLGLKFEPNHLHESLAPIIEVRADSYSFFHSLVYITSQGHLSHHNILIGCFICQKLPCLGNIPKNEAKDAFPRVFNRECEYFVPFSLISRVNHSIPDQKLRKCYNTQLQVPKQGTLCPTQSQRDQSPSRVKHSPPQGAWLHLSLTHNNYTDPSTFYFYPFGNLLG